MFCVLYQYGGYPVVGTAPWSALDGPASAANITKNDIKGGVVLGDHKPHFRACIVCQRPQGGTASVAPATASAAAATTTTGDAKKPPPPSQNPSGKNGVVKKEEDEEEEEARPPLPPLLLCSTCPASFHLACLRPRLRAMPQQAADGTGWSCAYCFATGRAVGGDSDGACGAVRLMESLRQGMQGSIRVCFYYLLFFCVSIFGLFRFFFVCIFVNAADRTLHAYDTGVTSA